MSLHKVEAKLVAVNELGCRLDDNLEQASKDLYRAEGAVTALKTAVASIENLLKLVDKELDENSNYDLQQMKDIKRYVDRARHLITNLANNAENNRVVQSGKVQGFEQAVVVAKRFKDEELSKVQLLQAAISQGAILRSDEGLVHTGEGPRPAGVRPASSIKERRRAEAEAAASSEKSEENTKAEQQEVKEEPTKPKGRRQKK